MWPPRRLRTVALRLLIGTSAVAAAWCGGGPSGPTPTTTTTAVSGNGSSTSTTSTTAPATTTIPIGSISSWVNAFGDTGWCGSPGMTPIARQLANLDGEIFLAGDLAYQDGRPEEFLRCFDPDFGRFKPRMWTVPGNHDYQTPGAAGYFGYFGTRAGPAGRGYYSIRSNSWLVLMLDSNASMARNSAQFEFVRQELISNTTFCTMAMWHHPFDTSGPNGPHLSSQRDMWELLYNNNVDLVISGHDHLYERHAPMDANQRPDPVRGIRLFIVGTGGAELYARARGAANSERFLSTYGLLRLHQEPALYEWQFLNQNGAILDSGLNICH